MCPDPLAPEAKGLKVLNAVLPQDVKLETREYDLGAQRWHRTG
ncbi:3-isopropylmalate dehydrogenase, partial [Streptomyces globisporus]